MSTLRGEHHVIPHWRSRAIPHTYERDFLSSAGASYNSNAVGAAERRASLRTADSMGSTLRHHVPMYDTTSRQTFRGTSLFAAAPTHGPPAPVYPQDAIPRADAAPCTDVTVQRDSYRHPGSTATQRPAPFRHTTTLSIGRKPSGSGDDMLSTTRLLHPPHQYSRREPVVPVPAIQGPRGSMALQTSTGHHFQPPPWQSGLRLQAVPIPVVRTRPENLTRPGTVSSYATTSGTAHNGAAGPAAIPCYPPGPRMSMAR